MLFKVSKIPLIGNIAFGIIDRGTNLLQIRPWSACNLNCIYCSVDGGPLGKEKTTYYVDVDHMLNWVDAIVEYKGRSKIEAHLDGVGEVAMYPELTKLVKGLRKIEGVDVISMQTNGTLLTKEKIDELAKAGLDRINISLNSLDKEKAMKIAGMEFYDVEKVKEVIEYAADKLSVLIAPVWVPNVNDEDIIEIIRWAKEIGIKSKWPILGIQKFEKYKHGRGKKLKEISWWKFYKKLEEFEKEFNLKLKLHKSDFGIHKRKQIPILYKIGEKIKVKPVGPGWLKNQTLAITDKRNITVIGEIRKETRVKIVSNKHNIYLALP